MSNSVELPEGFPFVSRRDWVALRPLSQKPLQIPVTHVRVTKTGSKGCSDRESCCKNLREVQFNHMYHYGFQDIGYNFLVGEDGTVYEGRGWNIEAEREYEEPELNGRCIDIAYIGKYTQTSPAGNSVDSANTLIKHGVDAGLIIPDYTFIEADASEIDDSDLELE